MLLFLSALALVSVTRGLRIFEKNIFMTAQRLREESSFMKEQKPVKMKKLVEPLNLFRVF